MVFIPPVIAGITLGGVSHRDGWGMGPLKWCALEKTRKNGSIVRPPRMPQPSPPCFVSFQGGVISKAR